MDSTNIDLVTARITQIEGILELIDPNSENAALWGVQALLTQAHDAAQALWQQGIDASRAAQQATV